MAADQRTVIGIARRALCAPALAFALLTSPAQAGEDFVARAAAIQALLDAGKATEGEAAAREVLQLAEQSTGKESAESANICRLVGDSLFNQERYADAEPFFRRALAVRVKALGLDNLDTAQSSGDLAITLRNLKRFDESERLYRQAIAIREKLLGPDHADVAKSWFRLSRMFDAKGDYAKAAEILGHAIEIGEKAFGPDDKTVTLWRGERAAELHDAGDIKAAEPLYRQAIAAAEAAFPSDDLDLANFRQGLANLLRQTDRPAEAEPLYRLALAAREKGFGADDRRVALSLEGLGQALEALDRMAEAVPLYQRALPIREKADGPDALTTASIVSRLGVALMGLDRPAEAELLFRRLLDIRVKTEQPEGVGVAEAARWIANAADRQGRAAEAEIFHQRALAISESVNGPAHLVTGFDLLSLGLLYSAQQRFEEAEPLLSRAVAIMDDADEAKESAAVARTALAFLEFSRGRKQQALALIEHSIVDMQAATGADSLRSADLVLTLAQMQAGIGDNASAEQSLAVARAVYERRAPQGRALIRAKTLLASIRLAQGRAAEALGLQLSVLGELEARYGKDNSETQSALADVGRSEFALGDYAAAVAYLERAVAITDRMAQIDAQTAFASRTGEIEDEAIAHAAVYDFLIKAYDRLAMQRPADRTALSDKAFRVAQRVIESQAASALSQLAARQAAGDGELAALVRERQDLVDAWRASDRALTEMRSGAPAERVAAREQAIAAELAKDDTRIREIDARLSTAFPAFANLQSASTVGFAELQSRLAAGEVMLFYADTSKLGDTGFETYLWVISKEGAPRWIRLERSTGELSAAVRELRSLMGVGARTRGAQTLVSADSADRTGSVLRAAGELYNALVAPAGDLIAGKSLLIVPSKKLANLPFHLLVERPASAEATDRYRDAAWLVRDHAVTVLPSVAALGAATAALVGDDHRQPYLGFANPLLTGRSGEDRRAFAYTACDAPNDAPPTLVAVNAETTEVASLFRGAAADVTAVRHLEPLPETASETCEVAAALGGDAASVRLGSAATEAEVKALSEHGKLAQARILHFATHGIVSGELAGFAEPALVLTPPEQATSRDDGLLTASEVTTLKLDADWVILSACNTAAGDGGGEALSGLARAFFYAGAKSLMVSHWPVNSDAAVALATGAIKAIAAEPDIGSAEALRRAMLAEIDRGGAHADPANWAPFILVGAAR